MRRPVSRFWQALAVFAVLLSCTRQLVAQVRVEAVAGEPFGVGRIVVPFLTTDDLTPVDTSAFELIERSGRTYYPTFSADRSLPLLREILGQESSGLPEFVTAYFLFTGSAPLELTLYGPERQTTVVQPVLRPLLFRRLLRGWWLNYKSAARQQKRISDYPPIVETYLTAMLAQRLRLDVAADRPRHRRTIPQQSLDLLLQIERLRLEVIEDTLRGDRPLGEMANQPLPADIRWRARPVTAPRDIQVEPIAMHVPEECFYIRFGKFSNYLWLRHLLEEHGGDISRMVTLRGTNELLGERTQAQLGLKESTLAEFLGDQVISDVALIGHDTFLREGAAIGILFEARSEVLARDLQAQRQAAVRAEEANGATFEEVRLGSKTGSLAATPDNRLRSFYVVDGSYHLVTNCRHLAERFLETGAGTRPLGRSDEFRQARLQIPLDAQETALVYLSRAFFRQLLSPQYQVELWRRLQAVADAELLQLARLAARAEGRETEPIEELVRGQFLPQGIGRRPDGSQTILAEGGGFVDSVRGARGSFLPIPDVPLERVTRSEAHRYDELAAFHAVRWQDMDPVLVGIRRFALGEQNRERVTIDARMLPFGKNKYGIFASMIGPPSQQRIKPVPDDVVFVQAMVQGGPFAPGVSPHHLFVGLQDLAPAGRLASGTLLRALQIARTAPGYLGAWPKPGVLDVLQLGETQYTDSFGYSRLPLGLWRLETPDGFSLVAFDRGILARVAPQLAVEQVEDKAQVRVDVGDISTSKFGRWANELDYRRAYQTSAGNARFLHMLSQQLHVPRADALAVGESLLDLKLICALGGDYQLQTHASGLEHWVSTKWDSSDPAPEQAYQSPLMGWFRGLSGTLTMLDDRLLVQAQIDMERSEIDQGVQLPLFNLFRGKQKQDPESAGSPQSGEQQKPKAQKPEASPPPEELPPPEPAPD